jgi:ketosteroid isomerase-like protein
MSQENVEIVRRAIDAFNSGGIEAALDFFDSGLEWTTTGIFVEQGTYRGHAGALRYMGALATELENLHNEPLELIDAGDEHVVVPIRLTARGRQSRAPVDFTGTLVYSLRGGKIVRIRNYAERAEALEAPGLSE